MKLTSALPQPVSVWEGSARSDPNEEQDLFFGFDLRRIALVIRRNIVPIAAIVGVFLAGAAVITLLATPRYTATASLLIQNNADEILEGSNLSPTAKVDDVRFLQTQVDVIKSRLLAERVTESEKLANDMNFFAAVGIDVPSASELEGKNATPQGYAQYRKELAVTALLDGLSVELPAQSRVVTLRFVSNSSEYSARIANAYADNFMQNSLDRKFESSAYARQFLTSQLEEVRRRLETSERDLNHYSRAAGLIRVSGQSDGVSTDADLSVTKDTLVQLNTATSAATAERVTAEDKWKTIANEPVLNVPQVLQNAVVQSLIVQRTEVQSKLAQERIKHLESYPAVVALKAQLTDINNRIETIGNSIKRSVYLDFEAAQQREASLTSRVGDLRSKALEEQNRGVQYMVLKRVADTNRATYDALLQRYNQLSAAAGAVSNNVSVVDNALPPSLPSSPNLLVNMVLALLAGLLAAGAFVLFREYLDDTVRAPADVEDKLGLPLLGLVPASDAPASDLENPKSAVSEAYHTLVANLAYSTTSGFPHVLAITSSRQGEGKSTTSFAIASNAAKLGKRTLLIDCDLRRPTLHARATNRNTIGLTALLTGQAKFDDVIFSGGENLDLMTALPMPAQPSVLLGGPTLGTVIAEARKRYDRIVLDCPPTLGLSDATTISSHADGVILMVDASEFKRGTVKATIRRQRLTKANLLGVVLNKFKVQAADDAYYAYSYYQYGAEAA